MDPERILIIRNGGLGDTLLLWPAVAGMRRRFPQAQIDLMGYPDRCQLLVAAAGADRALDVEGSGLHHLFGLSASLPPEVCARFNVYQAVVVFAAPGDYALAENLSACGVTEVHAFLVTPPEDGRIHVAEHARQSFVAADLALAVDDLPLPVTDSEKAACAPRLEELGLEEGRFAVVAPGSGSRAKNWAPEGFARLSSWLVLQGLQVVILQGPADAEAVTAVVEHAEAPRPMVVVDDPLACLKGILANAALLVGNDAGTSHLAAMLGVPTVAIFGPTDPILWAPRGPRVTLLASTARCAPCPDETMSACSDPVCHGRVDLDQVVDACKPYVHPVGLA